MQFFSFNFFDLTTSSTGACVGIFDEYTYMCRSMRFSSQGYVLLRVGDYGSCLGKIAELTFSPLWDTGTLCSPPGTSQLP